MVDIIGQAPDDEVTYEFPIGNIGAFTISDVILSSNKLTITEKIVNPTGFRFKANSTGVVGSATVKAKIMLSSGDVENKTISFRIRPEYI